MIQIPTGHEKRHMTGVGVAGWLGRPLIPQVAHCIRMAQGIRVHPRWQWRKQESRYLEQKRSSFQPPLSEHKIFQNFEEIKSKLVESGGTSNHGGWLYFLPVGRGAVGSPKKFFRKRPFAALGVLRRRIRDGLFSRNFIILKINNISIQNKLRVKYKLIIL